MGELQVSSKGKREREAGSLPQNAAAAVKQRRLWGINLRTTMGEEGITHLGKWGAETINSEKKGRWKVKGEKNRQKEIRNTPKQLYRCWRAKPLIRKAWLEEGIQLRKCPFRCSHQPVFAESRQLRSTLLLLAGQLFCQRAQCSGPRNNGHSEISSLSAGSLLASKVFWVSNRLRIIVILIVNSPVNECVSSYCVNHPKVGLNIVFFFIPSLPGLISFRSL